MRSCAWWMIFSAPTSQDCIDCYLDTRENCNPFHSSVWLKESQTFHFEYRKKPFVWFRVVTKLHQKEKEDALARMHGIKRSKSVGINLVHQFFFSSLIISPSLLQILAHQASCASTSCASHRCDKLLRQLSLTLICRHR